MAHAPDREPEAFRVFVGAESRTFLMSRYLRANLFFSEICDSVGISFSNATIRHAPSADLEQDSPEIEMLELATPLALNATILQENTVDDLNIGRVLLISRKREAPPPAAPSKPQTGVVSHFSL